MHTQNNSTCSNEAKLK